MGPGLAPQPIGSRVAPPDPSITSAIGRHHTLPTAVADLVDNSIDAGATRVLVRIMVNGVRPVGLQIIDDASGMDSEDVDAAMTYARRREYQGTDLGHFGIGLKAASLSQANTLVVWSKRRGSPPVGRRMRRESLDTGPIVEEFSYTDAAVALEKADVSFPMETGTIVEWQDVQTFLTSSNDIEQAAWTSRTAQGLLNHLGLVLHRILRQNVLSLQVENYDVEALLPGVARTVEPIDPFGYQGLVSGGYPKTLPIALGDTSAIARLHIWPHRNKSLSGFVQGGRSEIDSQGLYIYRRDRLMQAGGWNSLATPSPDLVYGRIEFDLSEEMEHHVTINPEKSGTTFDDELRDAFLHARSSDGTTLATYREDVKSQARVSRKRVASPVLAPRPGDGLSIDVKNAFDLHTDPNDPFPVDIHWKVLSPEEVFVIDIDTHTLVLNARYREAIVGRRSWHADDAPLFKSLLLLLLEDHFVGTGGGAKKKRENAAWQGIMLAAIRAQDARVQGG